MTCKECIHEKVCDALIKSGCPYLDKEIPAETFCLEFRNAADVVPRSEVLELENEIERLKYILGSYALQYGTVMDQHLVIEKERAEVAREIFEEIEKHRDKIHGIALLLPEELAELKKKYTEG